MSGYSEVLVVDADGRVIPINEVDPTLRALLPDDFTRYLWILDSLSGKENFMGAIGACVYDCSSCFPGEKVERSISGVFLMDAIDVLKLKILAGFRTFGPFQLTNEEVGFLIIFLENLARYIHEVRVKVGDRIIFTYG
jgi:hypothetical protein